MTEFRGGGGGWQGFGQYMRDKTDKLAEQYDLRYAKESSLFEGKTFWSTGRLEGIDFDIKEVITQHGGTYEQYGLRNVSHIIASNLALGNQNWKKLLGGKFAHKSYCVVTPQWLVDSIKAGRCQPESNYLPECIRLKGSLELFLGESAKPSESSVQKPSTVKFKMSMATSSQNLIRIEIIAPKDGVSVTEEICSEILDSQYTFARRGYLSITHLGSVNVFALDISNPSSCLSEALLNALSDRDWSGVASVALILYLGEAGCVPLSIFPSDHYIHPSSVAARVMTLSETLLGASEDSIERVVVQVLHEAGPCSHAILIDSFNELVERRRLDIARNLLLALRKCCSLSDSNRWFDHLFATAQTTFRFHNEGLSLKL
jgi:hypothetical protein